MSHGAKHCPMCDSLDILQTLACSVPIFEGGKLKGYRDENAAECGGCGWKGKVYALRRDKTFGDQIMDKLTHKDKEVPL